MKLSKITILASALALMLGGFSAKAESVDPVANPKAQVVVGNARFTVLTDRLIRMEWAANGKFEDNATLAIVNRNLPVPAFTTTKTGNGVQIKTSAVTLKYDGSGKFTESNLSVSFKLNGKTVTWKPGMDDSANLMGTARTLDQCTGPDHINNNDPMETGVVSRDGWAIVDESQRHLLVPDNSDWKQWVAVRPEGDVQDLYIFAYGHNYTDAIADFTKVAGKIPMPPKYVFGYWWSRYKAYSQQEFLDLANEFRSRNLPIDVMVIDMDWHQTYQQSSRVYRRDEFGQNIGWTGYSWNRDLFPDPSGFLNELHSMNLKTSLNLHPASGVLQREDAYESFVADYLSRTNDYDGPEGYIYKGGELITPASSTPARGNRPAQQTPAQYAKAGYHASVPFRIDQVAWADAYFNSVLGPLEKQGIDFWWLDWQQFKESKYVPGLSNTFWLNHTFFNEKVKRNAGKAAADAQRPLIYHRWGGLGSHRYQLGFSGDTHIKWEVLGYLPYFTATAANVGYGYWGHDLGGHMQNGNAPTDPELYLRWLQYGVFSPLFKTHCTSNDIIERRFWVFEDHYQYMKEALELRYSLTPYIYDAARQAYDTGVSLCRPMYYTYPELENAYSYKEQYMFGDNILAATICQPLDPATGKAERKVWLPAGTSWYDMAHNELVKGGVEKNFYYTISENAWFVKAGSIIPLAAEGIQNLQEKNNALRIFIAPGAGKSTYTHYEDDEVSQAYSTDYATTVITKTSTSSACTVNIAARKGSYRGMDSQRDLTIVLGGLSKKPASATMAGKALEVAYDKDTKQACIKLPVMNASEAATVSIKY
ncbi:MAG: glycoside hydrolase family 31 protein [Bacteroidales bacterium]|nr:glycoside hydrolase family 31 protein [Bacteroidales bacterium]